MNRDDHYISIQKSFIDRGFLAGLTEKARTVYVALNYFKDWDTGNCYPTISKLREVTRYHKQTIINATQELESLGLIKTWKNRKEGNRHYKKFYHINPISDISPLGTDKYHGPLRTERYPQKRDKNGRFAKSDSVENGMSKSVGNGTTRYRENGKELISLNESQRTNLKKKSLSFIDGKDKDTICTLIELKGKEFVKEQLRRAGRNPALVDIA